jgi:cytochrome c556
MERLMINIPDSKSIEVKKILKGMGVVFKEEKPFDINAYRKKLIDVGEWTEEDLKAMENAKSAFNSLKPQEW